MKKETLEPASAVTAMQRIDAVKARIISLVKEAEISSFRQIHDQVDLLQYLMLVDTEGTKSQDRPAAPAAKCAVDYCQNTSETQDACLLWFPTLKEWRCREHHPPLSSGAVRPIGWTPPNADREKTDSQRKLALEKLTREELKFVNRLAGG